MSEAISGAAVRSAAATPPSSLGFSAARSCSIQGKAAASVAGICSTPGIRSSAKVLIDGAAPRSSAKPRSVPRSAPGSSAIALAHARPLRGEDVQEGVEVADQFAERLLVHVEFGADFFDAGEQLGEIVGFGARRTPG